jgi:hypothetical protein
MIAYRIRCVRGRYMAPLLLLVIAACERSEQRVDGMLPSEPRRERVPTSSLLSARSTIEYSARVRIRATSGDGKIRESATDLSVTSTNGGMLAELTPVGASLLSEMQGKIPRSIKFSWDQQGGLVSGSLDDQSDLVAEMDKKFSSRPKPAAETPIGSALSSLTSLRKTASEAAHSGMMARAELQNRLVRFLTRDELTAQRLRAEDALSSPMEVGDEIEFRGRTAAGTVIARFDKASSAPTSVVVRRDDGASVELRYAFREVADGLFALVNTDFVKSRGGLAEYQISMAVDKLTLTGGK